MLLYHNQLQQNSIELSLTINYCFYSINNRKNLIAVLLSREAEGTALRCPATIRSVSLRNGAKSDELNFLISVCSRDESFVKDVTNFSQHINFEGSFFYRRFSTDDGEMW